MPEVAQWDLTKQRIHTTNDMVRDFLTQLEPELWFQMPAEGVTHIAWQVGHITVGNYGLGMARIRGKRTKDAGLIPESWMTNFGRGSTPSQDRSIYPSQERLLEVFDRVCEQLYREMETYELAALDEPSLPEHPLFKTKFDTLVFLPYHTMMHFGQMGLLRRLAGKAPLR